VTDDMPLPQDRQTIRCGATPPVEDMAKWRAIVDELDIRLD
jgi:hypothetical protein